MKIGMLTLGCRVNQYESDAIAERLENKGYEIAGFNEGCNAYIINTCTVTAESDSKCRKAIRRALRYGAPVAVIGCFVQGAHDEPELEKVTYLSGNADKGDVADSIERIILGEHIDKRTSMLGAEYEGLSISSCKYVKAYVKIEDGCNNFCSYCYVPHVRGRVRSRDEEEIICEVKRLKGCGYKEIILTGIETSVYGEGGEDKAPLVTLVEKIQARVGVERLRFGSLNPTFFTEDNLKRLSSVEGVMPHFHMSVQSASSTVLESMKRHYTNKDLYNAVENIREFFPNVNLSCDMICGFPGESEEDFKESLDFIRSARILHTHIFPYSKREGTLAAGMAGQIDEYTKHERARHMKDEAQSVHESIFDENIGKEYNVLAEFFKNGDVLGYTENFINLRLKRPQGCKKGDIIKVRIEKYMDNFS